MPVTRTLVTAALFAARLPLTLAGATLHRGEDAEWLPALAFESFEATVKRCVGVLTHDDALAEEGRLTQAKLRQFRMGVELETLADAQESKADAEFNDRLEVDAERRRTVSAQSEQRERAADDRRRQREREAAAQLEREAAAAEKASVRDKTAVARRERAARAKQVEAERAALAEARQALEAEQQVDEIGAELEASKEGRRAAE